MDESNWENPNTHMILDEGHNLIPADLLTWARFIENPANKIVKQEHLGGKLVSTVFLGLDHGFGGKPLWFETMVFEDGKRGEDLYCDRYETWVQAEEGHKKAVKLVESGEIK